MYQAASAQLLSLQAIDYMCAALGLFMCIKIIRGKRARALFCIAAVFLFCAHYFNLVYAKYICQIFFGGLFWHELFTFLDAKKSSKKAKRKVCAAALVAREVWIDDVIRVHIYGTQTGKSVQSLITANCALYKKVIFIRTSATFEILKVLIAGAEEHITFIFDSFGQLSAISWEHIAVDAMRYEDVLVVQNVHTRLFEITNQNTSISSLSIFQTAQCLEGLLHQDADVAVAQKSSRIGTLDKI